jgi:serine/threonine-protein kinase HipA
MAADIRKIYVYDDFSSSEPLLAGCLYITPIRGGESCAFEYDEEWLKKMSPAVSLDPELMPFPGRQYPAGKPLFGVFADAPIAGGLPVRENADGIFPGTL